MATVYRARLESQGGFAREFALKVIHPHLAAAEGFKDRFLDEARVASRVSHPNVVATVDSDQDRGYHYLVLELVDGITLRQLQVVDLQRSRVDEDRRLPPAEAARVVSDAARGLYAVHSVVDDKGEPLNVVHRDLSPHNLMLDVTGRTVLIDLGLAKARGQLGHTQTGVLCGKLPYMSPEQSRIEQLDARSDVFSLGSVLFELAVGEPPFGDDHTPGTLENLRKCDPKRLGDVMDVARVPGWLQQVILTCLRPDRDDRYSSAKALADALDEGMRRAGIVESAVRKSLAHRVQGLRKKVGVVQPAEPLPPLISADPTGSHRAVRRRWPGWARGVALAAAGAVLVLLGLATANAIRAGSATANSPNSVPNMAVDAVRTSNESMPAPSRSTANDEPPRETAAALEPEQFNDDPYDTDGEIVQPRKTRRSTARKRDSAGDLEFNKDNPYD